MIHLSSELYAGFSVDIFDVKLSAQAKDDLEQVPVHVAFKLQTWISGVKTHGLREIKKNTRLS